MRIFIVALILGLGGAAGIYFSANTNELEKAFFMGFGIFFGAIEIKILEQL